jgi:hypothetical protein
MAYTSLHKHFTADIQNNVPFWAMSTISGNIRSCEETAVVFCTVG